MASSQSERAQASLKAVDQDAKEALRSWTIFDKQWWRITLIQKLTHLSMLINRVIEQLSEE